MSIEVEAYPKRITEYQTASNMVASDKIYTDNIQVSGRGSKSHSVGDIKIIDTQNGYEYEVRRRPIGTDFEKKNGAATESKTTIGPGEIQVIGDGGSEALTIGSDDIDNLVKWAGVTRSLDGLLTEIYESMIHIDSDGNFYALVEDEE